MILTLIAAQSTAAYCLIEISIFMYSGGHSGPTVKDDAIMVGLALQMDAVLVS